MKILLALNKTLTNGKSTWIDGGYYNVFLPLVDQGHTVQLYDTANPESPNPEKVIEDFKPDLIWTCLTGNSAMTPAEPKALEAIKKQTEKGNCTTFNWFCDDTWRFDNFSSVVCEHFHVCSTPEPSYIEKYKEIGYNNIILGGWHVNYNFYQKQSQDKLYDVVFIGQINNHDRLNGLRALLRNDIDVSVGRGLSHEEMVQKMCQSKVGINFSKNFNGGSKGGAKTQMKARPFEIAAANSLVFTEYHEGIEEFFDIDKEIICFKGQDEMIQKCKILLKNDKLLKKISLSGHERFKKDHASHVRVQNILKEIKSL